MATNYAKASYTEVIDLQTINGETTVIGIHTPRGKAPYEKLRGFFAQFRKFKYEGISKLMMVPAASLPVDPLGISGIPGTTDTMDPRDPLNPILFHGVHGEDLPSALAGINGEWCTEFENSRYANGGSAENSPSHSDLPADGAAVDAQSDSVDKMPLSNTYFGEYNYYNALTDPSWKKFGSQSVVALRGLHPLVHKGAFARPLLPDTVCSPNEGTFEYTMNANEENDFMKPHVGPKEFESSLSEQTELKYLGNQMFTNGMARLGWLPTAVAAARNNLAGNRGMSPVMLPKLFMGVLVLSPSYKCEQFYRLVLRHEFSFKEFTASMNLLDLGVYDNPNPNNFENLGYFDWVDHTAPTPDPGDGISSSSSVDMMGGKAEVVSDGVS